MKKVLCAGVAGLFAAALVSQGALAQSINVPQVVSINPGDLFQDVVNGVPQAQSYYAPATLLGNYSASQPGNNPDNAVIGGDATTNLFQRGTSGTSVTATVTYGGPDRWAYWSGASTAMTVSQDTTAADLRPTYKASFKMARTSGQTGVVQVCMAQEVEGVNSYQFQGATAELDFDAIAGANFSGTGITGYIIYGTGADEGMQKLAFGLNAGGGGSTAWAGQANAAAATITAAANSNARYTVVGPIPTTATEVGVAICWTPVGTAGTNDYLSIQGIQLVRNSALTTAAGTTGAGLPVNDNRAKAFSRRSQQVETALQQRYTYSINEAAITAGAIILGGGTALGTTTTCSVGVPFPVTMRIAPTYANALTASTFKLVSASQAATALSTPFSATLVANSVQNASINFTTTGMTAKDSCELVSAAGTGQMLFTAEF